jgi:glycosyltransferase involved in cell wall biosynthesis
MQNNPLVSIIIPTYNRAHLIGETLDSVLAQTYKNWECIVVDDGSTDDTLEVIQKYIAKDSRFFFFSRPETKVNGASSSRNYGLSQSKGELIVFLDSDDWLLPNCLSQRVKFMSANSALNFMVFPMFTKGSDTVLKAKNIPFCDDYLREFLSYKLYWGIMCTTWKKKALLTLEGFNENYPRLNDPEIHIRGMLHFEHSYFIASEFPADSIYRMEEQKKGKEFSEKYLTSLTMFFNDMVSELQLCKKSHYIAYLKHYLKDYFKNFAYCISIHENLKLLKLAKKLSILHFKEYYLMCLWVVFRVVHFKLTDYLNSKLNLLINKFIKLPK